MHKVAVLALDGVLAFDLATPLEIFGRARLADGRAAYTVQVCAASRTVHAEALSLLVPYDLDILAEADTIILPGRRDPLAPVPERVLSTLREAASRGSRLASICVGAFTLAATGLLDGLRATAHWAAAAELARLYPRVEVDPDVLFVDNGQFLTSAGAAAGLDLCLHLIRRDFGAAIAADVARLAVMPLERAGGQAQFIIHAPPTPDGSTLQPLLRWLEEHADRDLSLDAIADQVGISTRTLSRRFREQTGTTPLRWLHRVRVQRAQCLLETTSYSVEEIAAQVGFGSSTTFREVFRDLLSTSPQAYRRAFPSRDPEE
ncbi:MAG: helix-turn-helix domain-containing protein [Acetobacteraceae bacterium]|nr:helix-turn-helix domain-containing protein [Acetobacteraceae bacterium]